MFTNPVFSKFFELGQVINTERGGGMFQPAVDEAVQRLQDGEWVSRPLSPPGSLCIWHLHLDHHGHGVELTCW